MAKVVFTHDDYLELSRDQDLELIEGELFVAPSPDVSHQRLAFRIAMQLQLALEGKGDVLCEIDMRFPMSTLCPDVIYISQARAHVVREQKVIGAPDLVVEVLSPVSAARDLGSKRRVYEANHVGEYWIVSPEARTVQVIAFGRSERLYAAHERVRSPELGITLDLHRIFG